MDLDKFELADFDKFVEIVSILTKICVFEPVWPAPPPAEISNRWKNLPPAISKTLKEHAKMHMRVTVISREARENFFIFPYLILGKTALLLCKIR